MRSRNFSLLKPIAALSAALTLALPALASAQQYGDQPTYAQPPPQAPAYGNQEKITGTVSGFDGQWILYMHDDRGYTDHVTLHQGTIINPTGIKLLEGMKVTIYGRADGPTFQANAVNVAYSPYSQYYTADGNPAYGYGDNGYGYGNGGYNYGYPGYGYGGYPGYGYGYGGYPYGAGIGIGINWGWGWGWGWPGYWGYPGYWWGGGYPYYGGYYGGCCYGRYPYRYPRPPYRGGGYPGTHGTVHGPPGGGAVRGGPAPSTGGGFHGGVSGGRPPHR